MRIALFLILLVHGMIHFMGFAKAYGFGQMTALAKAISKPMGLLWLLAGLLFILAGALYVYKREIWPMFAIIAVVLSQILIFSVWKDGKFGTIANVVILLVGISAHGNFQFHKMVQKETESLLQNIQFKDTYSITEPDISELPEIIQKWMRNSGVVGKEKIVSVHLRQKGEMKTKPEGKWMPFTAEQYFDVTHPAFVWSTEVDFLPMVNMMGRDKFTNGQGEMLIKLASLIPVVDEGNDQKINSAAMIRFMAEMTWFPSAALNDYITWEPMDEQTAKASFTINGETVSGLFTFADTGEMASFETQRYYGAGKNAVLETWFVKTEGYRDFMGFKIPTKCKVTWKLAEGDFNWLNFEITDLEYNKSGYFEK